MLHVLLTILILAPLAYGTTGPWARLAIQGAVFALLAVWFWQAQRGRAHRYRLPGGRPLAALLLLPLLQLVPLPPVLLRLLSPVAAARYAEGVWQLRPDAWMPLSVHPRATLLEAVQLFSAAAIFFLLVQLVDNRAALAKVLRVLVGFAGIYALLAILCDLFPNGRILWLLAPWPAEAGQPFGTYVNGNHFAGLMAMVFPLGLCWFFVSKPVVVHGNWRERLVDFFNDPQSSPHLIYGALALASGLSVFLSMSRGGILSCLGSLIVLGLLLAFAGGDLRRGLVLTAFFGLLLTAVGGFGWDPIFADFQRLRGTDGLIHEQRPAYWRDSLRLWRDHPLFGTGFGTFADAYRGYQSVDTGGKLVDHAHNDYVELLTDAGLVGAGLVGWLSVGLLATSWRAWRRRRSRLPQLLFPGVLAGLAAIALHGLTDFNLHIGANLLWFAALWGLLVAVSHGRSRAGSRSTELDAGRRPSVAAFLAVTLGGGFFCLVQGGVCLGLLAFAPAEGGDLRQLRDDERLERLLTASEEAARLDPLQADYRYAVGNLRLALGRSAEALTAYGRAIRRNPLNGEMLQQAGLLLAGLGDGGRAERLMRLAVEVDRRRPERGMVYGGWLLRQGRREAGQEVLRRTLRLAPEKTGDVLTLLILAGFSDRELAPVLPESSRCWLAYARYLLGRKLPQQAEAAFRRAFTLALAEPAGGRSVWLAARFFGDRRRYEEALHLLDEGTRTFPRDVALHRLRGQYAERIGLRELARRSYRQVLLLRPGDRAARRRLRTLAAEE
ncbi:O-antigen ligase [Geothermobacter ehrlichii]|uniref:O-antigen ligase n=1 Tax=Geothermobacter ehrlichii TaxID=213224 RepID=A0A5D3WIP9_9BACT|nr:O-antigen ligase family protein [Geothermobacter ehrlichii]TYO98334.1 O-antigen ligase [Geothermobacter ehrlichii]